MCTICSKFIRAVTMLGINDDAVNRLFENIMSSRRQTLVVTRPDTSSPARAGWRPILTKMTGLHRRKVEDFKKSKNDGITTMSSKKLSRGSARHV